MIVFYNTIIFVNDLQKSKEFYEKVIGLKIVQQYDTIVFFENHFVIHSAESIINTMFKRQIRNNKSKQGSGNLLIYFETDNLNDAYERILNYGCEIIHPIEKQEWGQLVFRFYDPDKHIIEIGEAMHVKFGNDSYSL